MSDREQKRTTAETPSEFPQTTPRAPRSYDEMDTYAMVFELQGTVHELKAALTNLTRMVERGFTRVEHVEKTETEIKEVLRQISPRLEDISGFIKHRAPQLSDKSELTTLKSDLVREIEKRPTRRQAVLDVAWIVGVITAAITFGSKLVH